MNVQICSSCSSETLKVVVLEYLHHTLEKGWGTNLNFQKSWQIKTKIYLIFILGGHICLHEHVPMDTFWGRGLSPREWVTRSATASESATAGNVWHNQDHTFKDITSIFGKSIVMFWSPDHVKYCSISRKHASWLQCNVVTLHQLGLNFHFIAFETCVFYIAVQRGWFSSTLYLLVYSAQNSYLTFPTQIQQEVLCRT